MLHIVPVKYFIQMAECFLFAITDCNMYNTIRKHIADYQKLKPQLECFATILNYAPILKLAILTSISVFNTEVSYSECNKTPLCRVSLLDLDTIYCDEYKKDHNSWIR